MVGIKKGIKYICTNSDIDMKKTINITLFILLLFATTDVLFSQNKVKKVTSSATGGRPGSSRVKKGGKQKAGRLPKNYVNCVKAFIGTNVATYYGEFCESWKCHKELRPSLLIGGFYRFDEHITFRGSFTWFQLYGTDEGTPNAGRNLSFRGSNFEIKADATYELFEHSRVYRRRHWYMPYIFGGFAFLQYNPKAEYEGKYYALRPLKTEGVSYGAFTFAVPYGLGIRFKVDPHTEIGLEAGYRWTFTDYLDDASNTYDPSKANLPEDDIARILTDRRKKARYTGKRGNPERNDGYFIFGITYDRTLFVTKKQKYNLKRNSNRFRLFKGVKK